MKKQLNLKEALMACIGFSVIGLFNLGLRWEERNAFVENITWELQSQLTLSKSQTLKVMEINYEFYDALAGVEQREAKEGILDGEINQLIIDKNTKILKVLTDDQQREWLKSYQRGHHK